MSPQKLLLACVACLAFTTAVGGVRASLLYESAEPLITASTGVGGTGAGLFSNAYPGAWFSLDQPAEITAIGTHVAAMFSFPGDQIFGVIVALPSAGATPDLDNNVVAQTLLTLPTPVDSATISGNVSVTLSAGDYAMVFGADAFGADPVGSIIVTTIDGVAVNKPGGDTTFSISPSNGALSLQEPGLRYFIEGTPIPEPSALLLVLVVAPMDRRRIRLAG